MKLAAWTAFAAIALGGSTLLADVKGRAHVQNAQFEVADAVAYKTENGVKVALMSAPLDRKAAASDGKIDDMDVFRSRGSSITLKIERDGSFSCVDWKSNMGGGSTCNSDFTKALTLTTNTADRIAGTFRLNANGDSADVTFDLKVESTVVKSGTPLPVGGGEPGRAALAHFRALEKGDFAALKATAPPDVRAQMEASEKTGEATRMFDMLRTFTPQRVKLQGGTVDGDDASIDFEGVLDGDPAKGTVRLVRVGGAWYVKGTTLR